MYAEILIEYNNKTIDKTFTYLIPSDLQTKVKVGMQVRVPFNKKLINGFVLKIYDDFTSNYPLKEEERLLLFAYMAIPPKIEMQNSEYKMCIKINKIMDYLYKTSNLIMNYHNG